MVFNDVVGCHSTIETHRLFSLPKNDKLRELWLFFLIPYNSLLTGLSKKQLIDPDTDFEMKPTIYKVDASPPARAVMMVADIIGLSYGSVPLNPVFREQDTPEMTKKNPMRTIPILEEDDYCLSDSHAIMLYLIDKFGTSNHAYLYPLDKRKRGTINQRLFFDCGVLFPRLRSVMGPTYAGKLTKLSNSMIRNIEDTYRIMEEYLLDTKFIADDVATVADICIITTVSSLHGLLPINVTRYPKLLQWFKNMSQFDFCKRINEPGAREHVDQLKALMAINKENVKSKI